ncbi:collagen alpha-5(VI) chain-like [Stylophora pistillata]|uniref:collagen alpha-5(VI) chain-like n=1 Tax=Stylophora pistillata TaxID=50429 RepID=UPI000C03ACBE|nr:collagen alpha-5(VI) chain-like [Stylophora pistillata]
MPLPPLRNFSQFSLFLLHLECEKPLDLAILVDISQSMDDEQLHKMGEIINHLVENIGVSEKDSHVGVVTFGGNATVLNDFANSRYYKVSNLKRLVTGALEKTSKNDGTRTDLAQHLAARHLFTQDGGDRPDIRNVVLLFTDGRFFINTTWDKRENITLKNTSRELEEKKAKIFVVGVGTGLKEKDFKEAAGQRGDVIIRKNFEELEETLDNLIENICAVPVVTCPVDVAFVVDSSTSISRSEFDNEKKLVKGLSTRMRNKTNNSREALVQFSISASVKVRFNRTSESFENVVQGIRKIEGRTRIDKALEATYEEFFSSERRRDAFRIAIVMTDGVQSTGARGLRESSEPLRNAGVRVIAVGFGAGMVRKRLRLMTESNGDVVEGEKMEDYFSEMLESLAETNCRRAIRKCYLLPFRS